MSTIDLKDAYFLVAVDPTYRKYLTFKFDNKLYQFSCLSFGLASAPYTFTKLIKPAVKILREI